MNSMLVANRPVMIPAGYTAIIMSNTFSYHRCQIVFLRLVS
jgi:hypothetical protein